MKENSSLLGAGDQTKAVHAGEYPDPYTRASSPNLVMSTTFIAEPDAVFSVEGMEEGGGWIYSRWGNPTVHRLEQNYPFDFRMILQKTGYQHGSLIFYLDSRDLQQTSFRLDTVAQAESWDEFAGEGIFRLSVGLEDAADLIADLRQALSD